MEILGEMKIIDCGKSGQARKLLYILGKKIYIYYCYFGNPMQDFVIDDKENIKTIEILKELNINMNFINSSNIEESDEFKGKTFVLTGSLEKNTRKEALSRPWMFSS